MHIINTSTREDIQLDLYGYYWRKLLVRPKAKSITRAVSLLSSRHHTGGRWWPRASTTFPFISNALTTLSKPPTSLYQVFKYFFLYFSCLYLYFLNISSSLIHSQLCQSRPLICSSFFICIFIFLSFCYICPFLFVFFMFVHLQCTHNPKPPTIL